MERLYGGEGGVVSEAPEYSLPCDGLTYTQLLDHGYGLTVPLSTPHTPSSGHVSPASSTATPLKAQSVKRRLVLEEAPSLVAGIVDADGFRTPSKTPRRSVTSRVASPHCSSPSPLTPALLAQHRAKNNASPGKPSRYDTSLGKLTKEFLALLHNSADGTVDLKLASEVLQVQKRRIYDITNVLEGIGLVNKKFKNNVQLMSAPSNTREVEADVERLRKQEEKLDCLIQQLSSNLASDFETDRRFAYMDHCDVKQLYHNSTVFMVSPPAGSTLGVSANLQELPLSLQLCTYGRPTVVHMYEGKPSWLEGMSSYKHNFATLTALSQLAPNASTASPTSDESRRCQDKASSEASTSSRIDDCIQSPKSSPIASSSFAYLNLNVGSGDLALRSPLRSPGALPGMAGSSDAVFGLPVPSPSSITPKKRSLIPDDAFTPPSKKPCRRRVTPKKSSWSPSKGGCVKVELAEDEGVCADDLLTDDVFATMFGAGDSNALDLLLPEPYGFLNSDDPGSEDLGFGSASTPPPFLTLEPPMDHNDYTFSLDTTEGLSDFFDFI
ncbi:transcription factor E2F4 [Hyalella azteca]|uniref:Transcription factor E2F4 n=1 Tax=Hyalella azteca TaxID=294128 RepID=A0A8B7P8G2_HYAAZ|nr:transcription factor E2F4 [Hyalella azteca]